MHSSRYRAVLAVAALAVLVAAAPGARADDAGKAKIDWQHKIIKATGSGAPDLHAPNIAVARLGAERAAKLDALRNILETLKGVKITSGSTAGGVMASDSAVKARVQGLVRHFKVVKTHYFSDGGVEVDVEMSLDGELAAALLPPTDAKKVKTTGKKVYTGLIIDASGRHVAHALAPKVVDEGGKVVYGPAFVSGDAVKARGVVGYATSLDAAKKSARVGKHPLVVRALSAKGTDLVITNADASTLENGKQNLSFLANGRVLVVTD